MCEILNSLEAFISERKKQVYTLPSVSTEIDEWIFAFHSKHRDRLTDKLQAEIWLPLSVEEKNL